jgi:2-(1,2-epoxy-1,2-dihydrophenyl)acetyl-CoA isomerase
MMPFTYMLYEVSERVGVITLNRPDTLNALYDTMREELLQALLQAEDDPGVSCVMITGAGRAFCAGGDIANMVALQTRNDTLQIRERMMVAARLVQQIRQITKPVIAAVNGAAAGAGMNLALACDLRWASEKARFSESFIKIGLVPDWGGMYLLTRVVGVTVAMDLMLTGELIDAAEALRLGVVSRLFPADTFREDALGLARRLAAGPASALARIKQGVYLGATETLAELLEYELQAQTELFLSADAREGMRAFLEKRQPVFGGDREKSEE